MRSPLLPVAGAAVLLLLVWAVVPTSLWGGMGRRYAEHQAAAAVEARERLVPGCPEGYVYVTPHGSSSVCLPGVPPRLIHNWECESQRCGH